ncbi:preprotein translocase subunit SecE [Lysobacter concretionis Ko07 = DSM 16239]|uniref:Protein translocase subunit SecE n=1 Tax=Lysobacter concretionis Ko07 = DSM 16239 TaxID=1122185 RepID=A0A0A0EID3_9GAMM|nr:MULTISPECIES: preprotein translocase subunit SecE [Lysobacter]KGM50721.1 preprotein translocase subunit SecE [Lysobacter concretionis Ko07 = DSM 16239]QOD91582.1 preprotein translocase subunit SecE [Lysobacter sp. CW239]
MNSKAEQNAGDILKYVVAVLLVAAGVFAFYWFEQLPGGVRALFVAGGLVAGAAVFLVSHLGVQTREFLSESQFELRKVVWPTRQEAMRTTWVVILAVVILSLILAGFDVVIQAAVKWLLGR